MQTVSKDGQPDVSGQDVVVWDTFASNYADLGLFFSNLGICLPKWNWGLPKAVGIGKNASLCHMANSWPGKHTIYSNLWGWTIFLFKEIKEAGGNSCITGLGKACQWWGERKVKKGESQARWVRSGTTSHSAGPTWYDSGTCSNKTPADVVGGKGGARKDFLAIRDIWITIMETGFSQGSWVWFLWFDASVPWKLRIQRGTTSSALFYSHTFPSAFCQFSLSSAG